jgi:hypothetical protein
MYIESSILHLYLMPSSPFLQYTFLLRFYLSVLSHDSFLLPSPLHKNSSGDCHLQYTVTGKTQGTSSVVYCVISGKHTCAYVLTALCRGPLQKLKVLPLLKKVHLIYTTRKVNTIFTSARRFSLF